MKNCDFAIVMSVYQRAPQIQEHPKKTSNNPTICNQQHSEWIGSRNGRLRLQTKSRYTINKKFCLAVQMGWLKYSLCHFGSFWDTRVSPQAIHKLSGCTSTLLTTATLDATLYCSAVDRLFPCVHVHQHHPDFRQLLPCVALIIGHWEFIGDPSPKPRLGVSTICEGERRHLRGWHVHQPNSSNWPFGTPHLSQPWVSYKRQEIIWKPLPDNNIGNEFDPNWMPLAWSFARLWSTRIHVSKSCPLPYFLVVNFTWRFLQVQCST